MKSSVLSTAVRSENGHHNAPRHLFFSTTMARDDVGDARWEWEAQCDAVLCDAIAALGRYNGSLNANDWCAIETRGPLTVSRFVGDDAGSLRLVGTGYIHGRLEDITRGLYCDTDADLMSCEAVLSRAPVLDGAVLHALETRGAETPFRFAGVKWCAAQIDDIKYELLTFERMGVTLDSDNTELAYHVIYSIPDRPDWPTDAQLRASGSIFRQRHAPENIKRLEPFVLCYLYRRVSEDLVLCYILGEYWGSGNEESQYEAESLLISRICMVSRAVECCEAKILTKMVEHCRDAPEQVSKTCLRCRLTRRSISDPLRLCGVCRKSVCRSCLEFKTTCRINPHTRTAGTEAICTRCLLRSNIPIDTDAPTPGNNTSNASVPHRPRRDRPSHAQRYAATELQARELNAASRIRRQVSSPVLVQHTYNYDRLLTRANSGSWTSSTSSKSFTERQTRLVTTGDHKRENLVDSTKKPQSDRRLSVGESSSSRSYDELYLVGGRSAASGEAERRYQLHLERNRRLSQEGPRAPDSQVHNQARSPPPPRSPLGFRNKNNQTDVISSVPENGSKPDPSTSVARKTMAIRDFYRDLYADM